MKFNIIPMLPGESKFEDYAESPTTHNITSDYKSWLEYQVEWNILVRFQGLLGWPKKEVQNTMEEEIISMTDELKKNFADNVLFIRGPVGLDSGEVIEPEFFNVCDVEELKEFKYISSIRPMRGITDDLKPTIIYKVRGLK